MYDVYSNPINILNRQLEMYGSPIEFYRYKKNDYNDIDYSQEPEIFSLRGLYHSGTGKMGASSAIRFAYMSDAGEGLGQMADTGVLLLYNELALPQLGDVCYLQDYKFYVQVITDILGAHKILDVSLGVTGLLTP